MKEKGRLISVDPGEKNIGIAISDPTATLARPLQIVHHIRLILDAGQIAQIAHENEVCLIIVGFPTGENGEMIPQSRHSQKLAKAIQEQSGLPVELWGEENSTQMARKQLIEMNVPVSKRGGHQDAAAAAVILQSYLDANQDKAVE
jgi:putative Holliday junction resolvase